MEESEVAAISEDGALNASLQHVTVPEAQQSTDAHNISDSSSPEDELSDQQHHDPIPDISIQDKPGTDRASPNGDIGADEEERAVLPPSHSPTQPTPFTLDISRAQAHEGVRRGGDTVDTEMQTPSTDAEVRGQGVPPQQEQSLAMSPPQPAEDLIHSENGPPSTTSDTEAERSRLTRDSSLGAQAPISCGTATVDEADTKPQHDRESPRPPPPRPSSPYLMIEGKTVLNTSSFESTGLLYAHDTRVVQVTGDEVKVDSATDVLWEAEEEHKEEEEIDVANLSGDLLLHVAIAGV